MYNPQPTPTRSPINNFRGRPPVGGPRPRRVSPEVQHAYGLPNGRALCPVCSSEQHVPRAFHALTADGSFILRCRGVEDACGQKYLYHPIDDAWEEIVIEPFGDLPTYPPTGGQDGTN